MKFIRCGELEALERLHELAAEHNTSVASLAFAWSLNEEKNKLASIHFYHIRLAVKASAKAFALSNFAVSRSAATASMFAGSARPLLHFCLKPVHARAPLKTSKTTGQ